VVLTVKQANPLEALGEVKINIKRLVSQENESFIPSKEEINQFKNLNKDFDWNKSKNIPFDKSWKDGVMRIAGSLDLSYLVEAMIDIKYPGSISEAFSMSNYGINEFSIENTFKVDFNSEFTVNVDKDAGFQTIEKSYSKVIQKDLSLAKFPIALPVSMIQLTVEVTVSAKIIPSAHIEGKAVVNAKTDNTFKANLYYKNTKPADWDSNFKKTFDSENSYTVTGDSRIEGKAQLTFQLTPALKIYAGSKMFKLATLEFGTDIQFSPIKLEGTLKSHVEADNSSFGVDARACVRADAELSLNPYASIDILSLYSKKWNADSVAKVKGWSWLDFMVDGGYFGSSSSGCHEGLEDKDGKCRAKEFWSVVGTGKDGLKCMQLLCSTDEQCQVNETTSKDKCIRSRCTTPDDDDNNNATNEMITIPAGSFTRGCVDGDDDCKNMELPATTVEMKEYKISKYEVTVAQYQECVSANKCKAVEALENSSDNQPVVNVTWTDAYAYCIWAGDYRLPTEAEWEKAAKGSGNSKFVWGNDDPTCSNTMMSEETVNGCGTEAPADVGTKSGDSSSYGVMDMAGNASEWVMDYFDPSYYHKDESLKDPKGPTKLVGGATYMSVKGGSWVNEDAKFFRTSRRTFLQFDKRSDSIGFRCAK